MADEKGPRNRQGKGRRKPPSLTVTHDEPVKAGNNTFSTVVRITISGWWEGGRPKHARLMEGDEGPFTVEIVDEEGSHPLIGLEPGSHHEVVVAINGREVRHLVTAPTLPNPEELALKAERTELERAKVADELAGLTAPERPAIGKKLYVTYTGKPGRQQLTITVGDINGNAIPHFPFILVDGEENVKEVKTGPAGAFIHQLDFQGHSHYVEVRAGVERDLIWRAGLIGPAPRPRRQP